MDKLIDINAYPVREMLKILLKDKTTKKNIIWATDAYALLGFGFDDKNHIELSVFTRMNSFILQPRISKTIEEQQERTRKKAEVMTPVWLCNKMNNHVDEEWFGRRDVFNHENEDNTWTVNKDKINFVGNHTWKDYVDSRRLEITCGEAPYLTSRYDTTTGELIVPPIRRIGMLDRKLRVVNENTATEDDWIKWSERAIQSCYGYEYQGDNLLIARINILLSFCDYFIERWGHEPDMKTVTRVANIICWNIWQMDGLKDTVPLGKPYEEIHQINLFEQLSIGNQETEEKAEAVPCRIYDWRANESLTFMNFKKKGLGIKNMNKKLFDFAIGNPPYQESRATTKDMPVYDDFMDAAYTVASDVLLITPARFLFNAGATLRVWNEKMLNDPHFKVVDYIPNSNAVFANTDIKGGVAITYRSDSSVYGPIGEFISNQTLRGIVEKVKRHGYDSLSNYMYGGRADLKYNDLFLENHPNYVSDRIKQIQKKKPSVTSLPPNEEYELRNRAFEDAPYAFKESISLKHEGEYYKILGLFGMKRVYRWLEKKYLTIRYPDNNNIQHYKIFISKASGTGAFGEKISEPIIGKPNEFSTPTFIGIGKFEKEIEAKNAANYIKTKFARALLSVLKITQDIVPGKFKYVPVQDFSASSDIDWNMSIHKIDLQLYKKYNLSKEEVAFIESNVKEMK